MGVEIQKIRQKTVVEQVMEEIKSLIATGQYKVGDRIPTEKELSEMFGVGRSSIREAIKIFNYLGILESNTARGTFVRDRTTVSTEALTWALLLGNDEMYDLLDVRGAIELWSMFILTEKHQRDAESITECLRELESELEKMRSAADGSDAAGVVEADYKFHYAIIKGSGNPILISMYEVLRSFMYEEIDRATRAFEDMHTAIGNHQRIVDKIKTGDVFEALKGFRRHIDETKMQLNATLSGRKIRDSRESEVPNPSQA
jgi:DNA-binding FadR family transcriptional regulator